MSTKEETFSDPRQEERVCIWIKKRHARMLDKSKRDERLSRQSALDDILDWTFKKKGIVDEPQAVSAS